MWVINRQTLILETEDHHPTDGFYVCLNRASIIGHCFQGELEYDFSIVRTTGRRITYGSLSSSSKAHALITDVLQSQQSPTKESRRKFSGSSGTGASCGGGGGGEAAVEIKLPSTSAYNIPVLNSGSEPSSRERGLSGNGGGGGVGGGGGGRGVEEGPTSGSYEIESSRYLLTLRRNNVDDKISTSDFIAAAREKYSAMGIKDMLGEIKKKGVEKGEAIEKGDLIALLIKTDTKQRLTALKQMQHAKYSASVSYLSNCSLSEAEKSRVDEQAMQAARFMR